MQRSKFVIQPFKDTSMMTADEAAASVQTIIEAVSTFPEAPPNFQFEAAFRMAYNLALHRYSEMLYGALEKFFCERAREMIPREDFRMCAIMTRDVTMYMDRTYVASHKRTPVYDMAMSFYDARVPRAIAHWRRHAHLVGRCAHVFGDVYTEVCYRPQHSGAKRSREDFEAAAQQQDGGVTTSQEEAEHEEALDGIAAA